MKYTKEQLEKWANGDLICPQSIEVYNDAVRETLNDMMDNSVSSSVIEEYISIGELFPFDYVSDLSAIISDLAEMLLDEREERDEVLKDAKRDLQDSIRNLDALIYIK